jgi:hypothetical protein
MAGDSDTALSLKEGTHLSFRVEWADVFLPPRSCEVVGLRREKSLFVFLRPSKASTQERFLSTRADRFTGSEAGRESRLAPFEMTAGQRGSVRKQRDSSLRRLRSE